MKAVKTENYEESIKLLYGVDITKDNEDIHPKLLCYPCYYKIMDCRKESRRTSVEQYVKNRESVVKWVAHEDTDCAVCDKCVKQSEPNKWRERKVIMKRPAADKNHHQNREPKVAKDEVVALLDTSLSSPLSKAEELLHTSLTKRKLKFSTDKKTVVCKTGGQVGEH